MRFSSSRRTMQGGAAAALVGIALTAPVQAAEDPCDEACLADIAERYMEGLVAQRHEQLPWADVVLFTEDYVSMMIGDALWGSISAKTDAPFVVADEATGNVAWFGWVEEHGAPAYYGMRLKAENGRIAEVETLTARKEWPGLYSEAAVGTFGPTAAFGEDIPAAERESRERLVDIAAGHYGTLQKNDGTLFTHYADDCEWIENGVSRTHADDGDPQGCRARMELGLFAPIDRVRDRRFPIVSEEKGIVVAFSTRDIDNESETWRTTDGKERRIDEVVYYPHSHGTVDIFKIRGGRIERIETVSNFLPYYMPSPWNPATAEPDEH